MKIILLTPNGHSVTAMKVIEDFHKIANHEVDILPVGNPDWILIDDYLCVPKIKIIGGDNMKARVSRFINYDNFKYNNLWV